MGWGYYWGLLYYRAKNNFDIPKKACAKYARMKIDFLQAFGNHRTSVNRVRMSQITYEDLGR